MRWIIDNWSLLAAILAAVAVAYIRVRKYLEASDDEKKKQRDAMVKALEAWLLRGVTEAEKDLGGGTGKLKLRAVYERALELFGPGMAELVPFDEFDELVQGPLEEMRKMLEGNKAAANYVSAGTA